MNDPSSPAPLVEQALHRLRVNAPDRTAAPGPDPPQPHAQPDRAQPHGDAPQSTRDLTATRNAADAATTQKRDPSRGGASAALRALRAVSVSAQARLADPDDFPELPIERGLPDLGAYVEHVMREAQAAAAAYRDEAGRETGAHAAKLLGQATASAEKIRQDADAYSERTLAQADALLAERLRRTAELTARLSQMAQRARDDFAGDQMMRDQMTRFISRLTTAAEEAAAEVFPSTTHDASS